MPVTRYEIRNEYSLADPELYRAADKDDPEALLEGVAMAGIVGVLRQLGDLAEFAAEIFHDLHEEVMATAARRHALMIRVQQLETEIPSIEKTFLSRTDHSSFLYNAGVEWHTNLKLDQNLVTQGDLPRFVMDSYEECRGPPRLFLLDKFDVAGAGACLKRYTDPSFFIVENSVMTSADVQREKKIRKAKKKGPRWRNGETLEVFPSHAKLHQLCLDEPVENGVSNPAHHAKLKRRLNGFPFGSKTGKSYLEKVFSTPSPEHKVLHEITVSSPLRLPANDHNESDLEVLEVLEVRSVSPPRETVGRKRSPPPSYREETMLNPLLTNEVSANDKICEVSNSYINIVPSGVSSTIDDETGEKDIAVAGESKTETSLTGYQSDDLASETDNYVDAPSTMDSEMDMEPEWRVNNNFTSNYIKNNSLSSVENEEHLHSQPSDSQSTGDLTMSEEGHNSSKKEISSLLLSDSPRTSGEIPQSENISAEEFPSAGISEIAIVDASSYKKIADEDFPVDYLPKPVVSDNTSTGNRPDFGQLGSILCGTDSTPILLPSDSGVGREGRLRGPKSDEAVSTSDQEEKKTNLITNSQWFRSISDPKSRSADESPRSSSGEHLEDEPNGEDAPCMSNASDVIRHTKESSAAISADLLHEDDSDRGDLNPIKSTGSTLNTWNVLSYSSIDTAEMISTENPIPGKLDIESPELPENFHSDYTDTTHNGDNNTPVVSKEDKLNDELYGEDLNVVSDVNCFSCAKEPSLRQELQETSFTNAETVETEELYANSSIDNQIGSQSLFLSLVENSLHDRDAISIEEIAVNGSPELGTPVSGEVMGLQGTGITADVTPNDFVAPESSCYTLEKLRNPAGTSDATEKDGFNTYRGAIGLEVTEISISADRKSLNEVLGLLDESGSKTDQSEILMASSVPPVSGDATEENVSLPVALDELVQEHMPCVEDSGLDELKNYNNRISGSLWGQGLLEEDADYLSRSQRESCLVEEVDEREAVASDLHNVFCSTISDYPRPEVSHTVPNPHLDSNIEHSLDFIDATQIHSPLGQSGINGDQESFQQTVENQVSGAALLPAACNTEETLLQEKIQLPPEANATMLQEKIQLPPDQIDQASLNSDEISSELSARLPVNQFQILVQDDHKGDKNSAVAFSLANCPPSVSELQGLRNYDINVSVCPNDSLSFIFPPSNLFSEPNQINLDESPPLPPLPPVQWRMGKVQHASSTTAGEITRQKELFPRESSPDTAPTDDAGSSLEAMKHSLIQVVPETTSEEVRVDRSFCSLEANSTHEIIDLPPKIENEQRKSSGLEAESIHETIDLPPKIENEQQHSSSLEANSLQKTIDLPPKMQTEQWQHIMPASESEVTYSAEEDGVANGSQTVKLPRPRNPLIDDVVAVDKSKLRKVTEQVRSQIQKADERDSLLEQIRTKSFNLKPAVASRPSIQGPKTNLKVAAILEKANAIRQALAGSDEDEDNWSDS